MGANNNIQDKQFVFSKPAVYQIKVEGEVKESWSKLLGGMQINLSRKKGKLISILTGSVRDQSALAGLLNTIYEMHLTVLSVKMLNEQ